MFPFYLLGLSNVSESSKDNFVATAVPSQHCDLCTFSQLISFLAKIKLGSLRAKWTWISTETRCWIVLKLDRERIRGRLFQYSSSTETRCRIVLMPAQATKKETTCPSTGLMRRRWVALTHWGAAGRQAMSKLPAQTGCQAAVLGFQPPPSHQATPRLYTSTTPWACQWRPASHCVHVDGAILQMLREFIWFLPWYHKFNYDPQHKGIKDFFDPGWGIDNAWLCPLLKVYEMQRSSLCAAWG